MQITWAGVHQDFNTEPVVTGANGHSEVSVRPKVYWGAAVEEWANERKDKDTKP